MKSSRSVLTFLSGWLVGGAAFLLGSALATAPSAHRALLDTTVTTIEENVNLRITTGSGAAAQPGQSIILFAPSANTADVFYSLNAASVSPIGALGESGVLHAGQSKGFDGRWENLRYESASGTQSIEAALVY